MNRKYKANDGGDAFLDRKGRVWYAAKITDLPVDPDEHATIPPAFWHPKAKEEWEKGNDVETEWAIATDRAEQRGSRPTVVR
jgi:hypothetical protein